MQKTSASIHPLVLKVTERQLRTLKLIYIMMAVVLAVLLVVTLWLGGPADFSYFEEFYWIKLALAVAGAILLGAVVPFARSRLMKPERIRSVGPQEFQKLGLPEEIDERIGRQALYLSRYTAGCVVTWGISEAVGLYGLMVGMMGSAAWITGLFFAAPAFTLAFLPPSRADVTKALGNLTR